MLEQCKRCGVNLNVKGLPSKDCSLLHCPHAIVAQEEELDPGLFESLFGKLPEEKRPSFEDTQPSQFGSPDHGDFWETAPMTFRD